MKKSSLLVIAWAIVSGVASADQAPAPSLTWNDCYIGVNQGAAMSAGSNHLEGHLTGDSTYDSYANSGDDFQLGVSREGFLGGGQVGCNWQPFASLILGLEADFQGTSVDRSSEQSLASWANLIGDDGAGGVVESTDKLQWLGTVRGRVGTTFGDPNLFGYVTGGLAYGEVKHRLSGSFVQYGLYDYIGPWPWASDSVRKTKVGWTVGAGAEWALWGSNWSLKGEYLYADLGKSKLSGYGTSVDEEGEDYYTDFHGSVRDKFHIVRVGLNYRFGGKVPPEAAPPAMAETAWTGCYAGLNAGGVISAGANHLEGHLTGDSSYDSYASAGDDFQLGVSREGFLGGGQVGCNWQSASLILGVETDFQGSTADSSSEQSLASWVNLIDDDGAGGVVESRDKLNWLGTVRGRVGGTFGLPNLFAYLTGGLAYGGVKHRISGSFVHYSNFDSGDPWPWASDGGRKTKVGWTVGAGAEWSLWGSNWSLKGEYLYADLGKTKLSAYGSSSGAYDYFTDVDGSVHDRFHIVRVGLNYRFDKVPFIAQ